MLVRAKLLVCVAACLLAGCSPSPTPSPSPGVTTPGGTASPTGPASTSASATPTPTWSADQAAAIGAVNDFRAASQKLAADPAAFTKSGMTAILEKSAGGAVLTNAVSGYLNLKKRGMRHIGDSLVVSTLATRASDVGYATQVIVTMCIDQRALKVVDKDGKELTKDQAGYEIPDFNLRQYTVQRRTKSAVFIVFGLGQAKGECGP